MCFQIGGVFSPADAEALRGIGFDGVFMPGSTKEEIVSATREMVYRKRTK
jgi:methylmalonyl-CoA mutase cobalamin-binding subunit